MALLSYIIVVRHEDNVRRERSTHFLLRTLASVNFLTNEGDRMRASYASVNTCVPSLDTIKLSVVYTGEIKKKEGF